MGKDSFQPKYFRRCVMITYPRQRLMWLPVLCSALFLISGLLLPSGSARLVNLFAAIAWFAVWIVWKTSPYLSLTDDSLIANAGIAKKVYDLKGVENPDCKAGILSFAYTANGITRQVKVSIFQLDDETRRVLLTDLKQALANQH